MLQNPDMNSTQADTEQPQAQPQPQQTQPSVPNAQPQSQPSEPTTPQQPTAQQQTVSNQPARTPADNSNANHPLVKHASVLHDIAETLAGGPRFKPTIDPATGKTSYQRVPLERKDIAMAIALSAIQGGLSGLQAKGPNATAQAAGLGFNATAQARQKADEEVQEQAAKDQARQLQTTETNLRMHANAMQVGKMDYESNQDYVNHFAGMYKQLQDNYPNAIKGIVPEKDLPKYHVTKNTAIPVEVVPRIDGATGNQAVDAQGAPQWDLNYAVLDPSLITDVPDDEKAELVKYGRPGFVNSEGQPTNIPNLQLKLSTRIAAKAAVAAGKLTQQELDDYAEKTGGKSVDLAALAKKDPTLLDKILPWHGSGAESLNDDLKTQKPDLYFQMKNLFDQVYPVDQYLKDHTPLPDAKDAKQAAILRDNFAKGSKQWSYYEQQRKTYESQESADAKARTAGENAGKAAEQAPEIEAAAQSLANGDLTSLKDIASMRGDERLKVYTRAKQLNPNFNTKDVDVKVKTQDAFTAGKQGDQIQSFNTFLGHAGEAAQASAAYRRMGSPLLNKPLNWLEKNAANDANYQTFVTALQPVRDEYMTFLQNNHALTESDKKAGETIMSNDSTPAQIEASLKQMAKTAFIRLDALNDRYKRTMGADFPDLLNDDAKNASNILGLGANAAKYQSGGTVTGGARGAVAGKREPAQPSAQSAQPVFARNPQTGARVVSNDGGKTWQPTQ